MKIKVSNFLAMFPRVHSTKLKDTAAELAINVDVSSGVIKPFYKLSYFSQLNDMGAETKDIRYYSFPDKSGFFQFPSNVDLTYSPIADDQYRRVYWSGDSRAENGEILYAYNLLEHRNDTNTGEEIENNPHLTGGSVFNPTYWYKLGIPAPTQAPIIESATNTYTKEELDDLGDEARIYVYTYVTEIGEESAPSPASPITITPHDKSTVQIKNLILDPTATNGRNVKRKRIYRSLTGSNGQVDLYLVAEIDAALEQFTDNLNGADVNTASPLPTINWDVPRANLSGLGVTQKGVNYAFTGKIACFSEPYYPYAWVRDYEVTLQHDIVAMGHYENYIIAATKGTPYLISGINPSNSSVEELPLNEPCVAKRSMVSMANCVCYASPNGIVKAYGATAQLVTSPFFDKDTWNKLNPSSIHAIEYRGKYLFFYKNENNQGAYLFDPNQIDFGIIKLDFWFKAVTRHHLTERIFCLDNQNKVYLLDDEESGRLPFLWRSKKFDVLGDGARMLAAQIIADNYDDIIFKVFVDDRLLIQKNVTSRKPFRLPNHSKGFAWQIEVTGKSSIRDICLAESMVEISK